MGKVLIVSVSGNEEHILDKIKDPLAEKRTLSWSNRQAGKTPSLSPAWRSICVSRPPNGRDNRSISPI